MNKRNYQKELEQIIEKHQRAGEIPRLLIHACCAPCSSYVMEYLSRYFQIDFYYYNPNIDTKAEYEQRRDELLRLAAQIPTVHPIGVVSEEYDPESFYEIAKGHEHDPERGERCLRCYELRIRKTAEYMKKIQQALKPVNVAKQAERQADGQAEGQTDGLVNRQTKRQVDRQAAVQLQPYSYFATTLSISPMKDAVALNTIGERVAEEYGLKWLPSDFKKKGGYLRSTELSREYGLYRQNYCGCVYSKNNAPAARA